MKPAPVQPMTLGNLRRNGVRALAAYAFAVMGDVFDGDQLIGHMDYLIDCKINPKPNIQRKAQLIVAMIKTIKPSTTVAILAAPFL